MLYTVIPLERVYADLYGKESSGLIGKADGNTVYKEVMLPHGRIVTRLDGENYIIERIHSTEMKDYLNEDYVPGKKIE